MSTIRDIARHARVAVSTASLALRGDGRVRPETRRRVLAAAEALDYRPSRAARSLSIGRTYSINLLDPAAGEALTSGFFSRFVRGLHDAAGERDYSLALSIVSDEEEAAHQVETLVRERWTDGVVLLNPSENTALLDLMVRQEFPHVILGQDPRGEALSVDSDNPAVAADAARRLLAGGRRNLRFINGPRKQTFTSARAAGFVAALEEAGIDTPHDRVHYTDGTPASAAALAVALLDDGVDGVHLASDTGAVALMRALVDRGARVPDDVALIGTNNDTIGEYISPRLTSIDLNAYQLGREAARLLLQRVDDPTLGGVRRLVPHQLVIRESA